MQEIRKGLRLNRLDYYEMHLSIINCILPVKMTPMEIKVMASFMSLKGDIGEERFGATAKKLIKKTLDISTSGLSNYMRSLISNKFLLEGQGGSITILPILFPEDNEQVYYFKLINIEHG